MGVFFCTSLLCAYNKSFYKKQNIKTNYINKGEQKYECNYERIK